MILIGWIACMGLELFYAVILFYKDRIINYAIYKISWLSVGVNKVLFCFRKKLPGLTIKPGNQLLKKYAN